MPISIPLQVTVALQLQSGPAQGERRFRLCHALELFPPTLCFAGALPIEGGGQARVSFALPAGSQFEAAAALFHDPEYPERGSRAELLGLSAEQMELLQAYQVARMES